MKILFCNFLAFLMIAAASAQSLPNESDDLDCIKENVSVSNANNDTRQHWRIDCIFNIPNEVQVFNRWGQAVFSQKNYKGTWYGLDAKGKPLPMGVYYYLITVKLPNGETATRKGNVTVMN